MKDKKYKYVPAKPKIFFNCDWGVYPAGSYTSTCYTTDKIRARLISIALTRFMNSDEGKMWVKKNITDKGY